MSFRNKAAFRAIRCLKPYGAKLRILPDRAHYQKKYVSSFTRNVLCLNSICITAFAVKAQILLKRTLLTQRPGEREDRHRGTLKCPENDHHSQNYSYNYCQKR